MNKQPIPTPVAVVAIILLVIVIGVFIYRGVTGGTVGAGEPGKVVIDPRDIYKK
jgi:hypothetical protein